MTARALVAFGDTVGLWWLRLLRPGFRHCFVAVETSAGWVVVDPLSDRTRIEIVPIPAAADLAEWYERNNYQTIITSIADPIAIAMPWRPYSCVEEVKRVLGIRAGNVLTPWQLYKYISRNRNEKLDSRRLLAYIQKRAVRQRPVSPALPPCAAEFLRR